MFTKKSNNSFNYFAHDLNNIFAQNLLTVSLLKNGITDKALIRLTERIEDSIKIAQNIVSDAVKSTNKLNNDIEKISLGNILHNVISLFEQQHSDNIIFKLNSDNNLELIAGKQLDFFRLFFNIIDNSIKAIPEIGIIACSLKNITEGAQKYIEVIISDNGHGINSEQIDTIVTNPHFPNEEEGISGLGLHIIYSLVKKYNGIIEVTSNQEGGTVFSIKFPIHRIINRCVNNYNKLILIGDDEEVLCELLADLLNASGYNVIYANNGEALLNAAENFIVDLAIIDKNMPLMDGIEIINEFNNRNYLFPVILATGSTEFEHDSIGHLTLKKIISKPFVFDELLAEIQLNLV